MKYLFLIITLSALVACKKGKKYTQVEMGSDKNMELTFHDKSIQAFTLEGGFKSEQLFLDIDNDGVNDFLIKSTADSIIGQESNFYWNIDLTILGLEFEVLEVPNSGRYEYTATRGEFDYIGTYPREIFRYTSSCVPVLSNVNSPNIRPNNPNILNQDEILKLEGLDWNNATPGLRIAGAAYKIEASEYNDAYDSLFTYITEIDAPCYGVNDTDVYYVVVRKKLAVGYQVGWIQFRIEDQNKFTLFNTAFSTLVYE